MQGHAPANPASCESTGVSVSVDEHSTPSPHSALSLIRDCGQGRSPCGYCGSSEDTSCSYGMHADVLTVDAYQALLDRGWRRSGRWVYKPLHSRTCCQLITIRLNVDDFKPNKEQRRVQRRWQSYLNGRLCSPARQPDPQGTSPKRPRSDEEDYEYEEQFVHARPVWNDAAAQHASLGGGKRQRSAVNLMELEVALDEEDRKSPGSSEVGTCIVNEEYTNSNIIHALEHLLTQALVCCLRIKNSFPVEPEAVRRLSQCRAKVNRLNQKQRKRLPKEIEFTSPFAFQIAALVSKPAYIVAAKLVQCADLTLLPRCVQGLQHSDGHINFLVQRCDDSALDSARIHGEGARVFNVSNGTKPGPVRTHDSASPMVGQTKQFELKMVPSSDPSLDAVEFELYEKYQVLHHGDDPEEVTVSSFRRFLCDSPLIPVTTSASEGLGPSSPNIPPCGFGSFHQQYWVDDRLVAVGVIDVLPKCLSSKYLFWDPDLAFLSLGKLTSLLEIDWVRGVSRVCPSLKYYYLGYYVHSCHRMRYKADFGPSDVLCPVSQCWVPFDRVKDVLATNAQFPSLATVPGALEGLSTDHCVNSEGLPASPPRIPTAEEVASVRMYIPSEWSSVASSRMQNAGGATASVDEFLNLIKSGGTIVTFGMLCMAGILGNDVLLRLRRRLERWMVVVGPAWQQLVYRL